MHTNLVLEDLQVIRSDVLLVNYTKLAELRGGPLSIAGDLCKEIAELTQGTTFHRPIVIAHGLE